LQATKACHTGTSSGDTAMQKKKSYWTPLAVGVAILCCLAAGLGLMQKRNLLDNPLNEKNRKILYDADNEQ